MLRTLLPFLSRNQTNPFVNFMVESKNFVPKIDSDSIDQSVLDKSKSSLRRKRVLNQNKSINNSDDRNYSADRSRNNPMLSTIENTDNERIPKISIEKFTSNRPTNQQLLDSPCDFISLKNDEQCFGDNNMHNCYLLSSFANFDEKKIIEERLNSNKPFIKWFVNDFKSVKDSEAEKFCNKKTNINATNQLNNLGKSFSLLPIVSLKGIVYKKKTKSHQRSITNRQTTNNKEYQCKLCEKKLPNQNSLGGHMRTKHHGQSEKYKKKKETEKKHERRRLLNREAKRILEIRFENSDFRYSRQVELKKIKKELEAARFLL